MGERTLVVGDVPVREAPHTLMVAWGDWVGLAGIVFLALLAAAAAWRMARARFFREAPATTVAPGRSHPRRGAAARGPPRGRPAACVRARQPAVDGRSGAARRGPAGQHAGAHPRLCRAVPGSGAGRVVRAARVCRACVCRRGRARAHAGCAAPGTRNRATSSPSSLGACPSRARAPGFEWPRERAGATASRSPIPRCWPGRWRPAAPRCRQPTRLRARPRTHGPPVRAARAPRPAVAEVCSVPPGARAAGVPPAPAHRLRQCLRRVLHLRPERLPHDLRALVGRVDDRRGAVCSRAARGDRSRLAARRVRCALDKPSLRGSGWNVSASRRSTWACRGCCCCASSGVEEATPTLTGGAGFAGVPTLARQRCGQAGRDARGRRSALRADSPGLCAARGAPST